MIITKGSEQLPLVLICKNKWRKSNQGGRQMEAQWWKWHCLFKKTPHVGSAFALSLPAFSQLHDTQRGTVASNALAAVFRSHASPNPAFCHLTPAGGEQGSNSYKDCFKMFICAHVQGTFSSAAATDILLLLWRNTLKWCLKLRAWRTKCVGLMNSCVRDYSACVIVYTVHP